MRLYKLNLKRSYLALLLLLTGTWIRLSAQANCGSAVPVTDLTGVICATGTPSGTNTLGAGSCEEGTFDTWFSFVAQGGSATITVSDPSAGWRPEFLVIGSSTNTCAGVFTEISCTDGAGNYTSINSVTNGLVPGNTYWIVVSSNGNSTAGTISVCVNNPAVVVNCVDNDACVDAAPFVLNAPGGGAACISDCNTGANPGLDFVGSVCEDMPNPTVWYSFTTSASTATLNVNLTSGVWTNPEFTIFVGNTCTSPYTILTCVEGSGGAASSLNLPVSPSTTYVIAVSDVTGDQGNFNLCITQNQDNSACNTTDQLSVTSTSMGSPLSGPYQPGEFVTFCYTVTNFIEFNCNYIGAFVPTFGNCWDPTSFNAQGMPINIVTPLNVNGVIQPCPPGPPCAWNACVGQPSGSWNWFPAGAAVYNVAGYYPAGTPMPAGWYFLSSYDPVSNACSPDPTDPDNTYGDGNFPNCGVNTFDYTLCFTLKAGPLANCGVGQNNCSVSIRTFADGEFGAWNNIGCTGDAENNFPSTLSCCTAPTITPVSNMTVCNNTPINVFLTSDQDPTVSYSWTVVQGLNISGGSNGTGTSINQTLVNSGTTTSSATYTITANNGSCSSTSSFTVTVVPTINVSISAPQTVVNCTFPSVTMTASSTSATPSYQWTGGPATAAYNVSSAGTYTVTVTSTNGCTASATQIITSNFSTPTASAGPDQMLTCIVTSVVLDGSGSSSGAGITYNWSGPSFSSSLQSPSTTTPGTYTITVTNTASGCTATDQVVITSDPTVPVASAGPDQSITCLVSSVNFDGSGSSTGVNYTYSWSGPGAYSSSVQSPTGITVAGVYTLTVTNTSNSCTATDQVSVILNNTPPVASAGPDQTITCTVNPVTLDGSGSASGPTITYSWSGPAAFSSPLQSPTTSVAGVYAVLVTNTFSGCTNTSTVTVTMNNTPPIADAGSDDTLTCIVLNSVLGGPLMSTGPTIGYVWLGPSSFGSVLQNPTVNITGTYTLTVTNSANGCSSVDSVTIFMNNVPPVANAGPIPTINCNNATVSLDGSNSDNGPGFSVQWNGPSGYSSAVLSPNNITAGGSYTITITNTSSGCTSTASVVVNTDTIAPTVSAGPDLVLDCAVPSDTLLGSSSSISTYSWTTSTGNILSGSNTSAPIVNAAGTYVLVATDLNNGCSGSDSAMVTLNAVLPNANAGADQIYPCSGGNISLNGGSSSSGVAFSWSTIGGNIVSGGSTSSVNINNAGWYIITVTDTSTNCMQSDTVIVTDAPTVSISVLSTSNPTCFGGNNGTATASTTGGTAPFNIVWSPIGGTALNAVNLTAGNYVVTVTDNYGCTASDSATLGQPTAVLLTLVDSVSPDCGSSNGSITVTASGGTPGYAYSWVGSSVITNTNPNISSGTYTAIVTDTSGCKDSLTIVLNCKALPLVIPQFISPNSDGDNDTWVIQNLGYYPKNKIHIYNRWGNMVYSAEPYTNNWNGTPNVSYSLGNGPLPTGTYFYVIDLYGDESKIITDYIEIQK